jgi:hypothetical protein
VSFAYFYFEKNIGWGGVFVCFFAMDMLNWEWAGSSSISSLKASNVFQMSFCEENHEV